MDIKFKKLNYEQLLNKYSIEIVDNEPSSREFIFSKINFNDINKIDYSVVMPIFNQGSLISKHIDSIIKHMIGSFELILILDFCVDNTEEEILKFFTNYKNDFKNFKSVTIVKHDKFPIFESSSDNLGFMLAEGDYLLEIQCDMEMTEPGFNLQLKRPFDHFENCIGVSGRCTAPFEMGGTGCKCSDISNHSSNCNLSRDIFYQNDTCNRGPLMLDRKKSASLRFLNEKNFHLCYADHNFFARASEKNFICGYMVIDFYCRLDMGASRKRNSIPEESRLLNEKFLNLRKKNSLGGEHAHPSVNAYQGINLKRSGLKTHKLLN